MRVQKQFVVYKNIDVQKMIFLIKNHKCIVLVNIFKNKTKNIYKKKKESSRFRTCTFEKKLLQISHHVSNSLAMVNKVPGVNKLTTSSESDEVFP